MRRLVSTIFRIVALSMFVALANAQVTDQAAREQASSIVRSELHSDVGFKSDEFLGVQRDEELERSLAVAAGGRAGLRFIYKVSPIGYEIRENAVLYHAWSDFEPVFIVAVSPTDGSTYRIHGFGIEASLAEFEKLMAALRVRVSRPEQAEYLADFYRRVNPENSSSLTPISSLLDLKQAAERQCQDGLSSFDVGQKAFNAWWKHAKPLYARISFKQTAAPRGSDYLVEWIVLSSAGPQGNCGGAPLQARLEVTSDGHVGKLTFSAPRKG
jgi:hypothetical protein